jgi:hypothetical protein
MSAVLKALSRLFLPSIQIKSLAYLKNRQMPYRTGDLGIAGGFRDEKQFGFKQL